jgi:tetratricopeptide (TPR) repeat protein
MRPALRISRQTVTALLISATALFAQAPPPSQDPADLLKQGQQKMREGKQEEALALYRQALQASPKSFQANNQTGVALDMMGHYAEARKHFGTALDVASNPQQKETAQRAMAMSFAFENNCKGATPHESDAYEAHLAEKDFYNAGERANELARICIEAGDFDTAATWYQRGHDAGLREPDIKPDRKDLWEFRQEHALARLAARRGNQAEARKHVEAAKAVLDRGTNPTQAPYYPYLTGYVAFYGGDYKTALSDLQKADQRDPFILCLIAQTYEKLGDRTQALDHYTKALAAATAHNPPTAYARPLAKKKLG